MITRAYIGLGSNVGERESLIEAAIQALAQATKVRLLRRARLYETAPLGRQKNQPWFLNTVVEIETTLSPQALLALCKQIERSLGRRSRERHGPREIDLDILLYDNIVLHEPDLTIPHAELHRRRFALAPLAELAPEQTHPVIEKSISQLLDLLEDPQEVTLLRRS